MALAGALQVNTMLEELDLGETDLVSTCTFSGGEVVLYECLVGRGDSGFQVTGMIEWGEKSKPKKLPGPKVNPQKSHAKFLSHKNLLSELRGRDM